MNRIHLSMAASLLLYLGAVLAGWCLAPVAAWPVFLGIFLLWSILMRPGDWPRDLSRWVDGAVISRALAATGMQAALALACLAVGWLLAWLVPLPPVGPWPGVLLSLVGVGAARLVWNPAQGRAGVLDRALRQVRLLPPPAPLSRTAARQRGKEAEIDSVIGFTADTPAERVEQVMPDLTARFAPPRLLDGFARLQKSGRMNPAQARALVLLATDPAHALALKGHEAAALAFRAVAGDAALLDLFSRRYVALLAQRPDALGDGPSNPALRQAEKEAEGTPAAAAIRALREGQLQAMRQARGETLAGGAENP